MRIVLTTYPDPGAAEEQIGRILEARLAACAQRLPIEARYWWKERIERANEQLVLFKTVPKRVGALFEAIQRGHPYEVPEIVEIDVPRVVPAYLDYLAREVMQESPPPLGSGELTRRGSHRGRGAARPPRKRARRRPRSIGT